MCIPELPRFYYYGYFFSIEKKAGGTTVRNASSIVGGDTTHNQNLNLSYAGTVIAHSQTQRPYPGLP
jgi:hypothetical protein